MKQPMWILNSSLLVLCCISQAILFMLQKPVPRKVTMSPGKMVAQQVENNHQIDTSIIYGQRDLFGTYIPPIMPVKKAEETLAPIPQPPKFIPSSIPEEKTPTFFTPLDVILKGVIFVQDDPASSLAIIQFKKTKEEQNYQVGDLIEDSQLLKILPNRIIIIRSNGQQETLYLREEDAINDFDTDINDTPKNIVYPAGDNKYKVNMDEFIKRVNNLGEFITLLDLTSVYKQGHSFGCRVGNIEKDSLGQLLGLKSDDIILKINDIAVDNVSNRIKIYDHIKSLHAGDLIDVLLYRNKDTVSLIYGLIDNELKNISFDQHQLYEKLTNHLAKQQEKEHAAVQAQVKLHPSAAPKAYAVDAIPQDLLVQGKNNNTAIIDTIIDKQDANRSTKIIGQLSQQTLNQGDAQAKKLYEEKKNITPALKQMKTDDRKTMLRQSSSRNVISGGMKS